MLILQNINYFHSNREVLFDHINVSILSQQKIALIGHNGVGKSTLLQLMAGILQPNQGTVLADSKPYYIPQVFGQFNGHTIAEALKVDAQLKALTAILDGDVSEAHLTVLEDDWSIEERCREALSYWDLAGLDLSQSMATLSGGQKTKVFLAGIGIHRPEIVLMDEPSNHLDRESRSLLYDFVKTSASSLVVVSHDRELLNMLDSVYELSKKGITVYGGNYDFYLTHKEIESEALALDVKSKEKALRKAKEVKQETMERQQKLDARGKKKQEKAGLPTISMNTFKNNAEKSTARIKDIHAEKIGHISQELQQLRTELPGIDKIKFGFEDSTLHQGKLLIELQDVNMSYGGKMLWNTPLTLSIKSGARLAIEGPNGAGKTTLIRIILGQLQPTEGSIQHRMAKAVYVDQEYSLIDDRIKVYEQAQLFNTGALQEHEVKIRLSRFLFPKDVWDKPCGVLSGGEKMRLMLCCLTIDQQAPDLIVLDEPTNNLDLQNIGILTAAIVEYKGTLLVVSHDTHFVKEIQVQEFIGLG